MLLPLFQSIELSTVGQAIKNSSWAFAVIESVHLLALAVIGGTILIVDMRLLGLGLKRYAVSEIANGTQMLFVASLIVMLLTGGTLFVSEAVKCYFSTPFWVKMTSLALATLFTFTVRRRVALSDELAGRPWLMKVVALVSLSLWLCVGAAGRWIGFSG
jgi:hypothetical protein